MKGFHVAPLFVGPFTPRGLARPRLQSGPFCWLCQISDKPDLRALYLIYAANSLASSQMAFYDEGCYVGFWFVQLPRTVFLGNPYVSV